MKKQALALAIGLASAQPQFVQALSLGVLQVDSALSQPLRARIDLHDVVPDSLSDLNIRVASDSLFQRMGMERSFILNNLRFDAVMRGDQPSLLIHTRYPFNEPFLNLLLEVSHQDNVVLQEYMLMPELPQTPAQVRADGGRRYQVKRGDTLLKIASRFRYAGTNSNQMMLALLKRNPQAFIRGDANRLKANVPLIIPSRQAVSDISRRDAQVFRGQLVKNALAQRSLAKQPVAQPERSEEARLEVDKARQHLQALKKKTADLTEKLTTPRVDKVANDMALSTSTVRRLTAQLEVKDLKIAELQMRLARLNKKVLVREAATTGADISSKETAFDSSHVTMGEGFEPTLIIAPRSVARHTIDMASLPKATTGSPSPADADEGSTKRAAKAPVVIRTVQQPRIQTPKTPEPVPASMAEEVAGVTVLTEGELPALSVSPPQSVQSEPSVPTVSENSVVPVAVSVPEALPVPNSVESVESAREPEAEESSVSLFSLLTSPLLLYIELGAFFLLALLWLYARHQRRKWRLVDDVVRELEVKRAEEGRSKMIWDKLVYAPEAWLIDLPHIPDPDHLNYLPAVEQFETLLMNTKSCGTEAGSSAAVMPEEFQNPEVFPPDDTRVLAVNDVDKLRQQIDEMQQVLARLQQHRASLQQQRSAA